MKVASWNVNSLRVRLPHVIEWLNSAQPDVLALQETKLIDDQFPADRFRELGYHSLYAGQKTYNGVAILARTPLQDPLTDVPGLDDPQRRILGASVDGLRILDLYVINGQSVDSEKYAYKLAWLRRVTEFIAQDLQTHPNYIVLGDFNITPDDRDVHDPEAWKGKILCSQPERDALGALFQLGLKDCFRLFDQPPASFSWWDYRAAAFRRNLGLRIDLILASSALAQRCRASYIDTAPRKLERPSDHAPVVAEFDL